MNEPLVRLIVGWILIAVQLFFIIYLILASRKSIRRLLKWSKERYEIFTKQMIAKFEAFKDEATNRINLLSKENVRLREENEKYRQKLKNLGFTDADLDI